MNTNLCAWLFNYLAKSVLWVDSVRFLIRNKQVNESWCSCIAVTVFGVGPFRPMINNSWSAVETIFVYIPSISLSSRAWRAKCKRFWKNLPTFLWMIKQFLIFYEKYFSLHFVKSVPATLKWPNPALSWRNLIGEHSSKQLQHFIEFTTCNFSALPATKMKLPWQSKMGFNSNHCLNFTDSFR